MKIKVKDLSDELVDLITNIDCDENCGICSFCRDAYFMGMTCIPMFIRTMRNCEEYENEEIDLTSLSPKTHSNVIELCEDLELDKDFISDLKESIQKKEEVQKDLEIIFKYLKDSSAGLYVIKSFENIENYLENN